MRVVLLGAGYWGVNYLKELGRQCVCVVEPDELRRDAVGRQYEVPTAKDLADVSVPFDAAIIATPPDVHVPLALELVRAGKNVLIEKPIAHTSEEVSQLVPYSSRCMCGFIYLYHPQIVAWKRMLENDDISHVFMRRTNDGPVRSWRDAAWDLATHDAAISTYWFGMPYEVQGLVARDYALVRLKHIRVDSLIYVAWRGGPKTRRIEVVFRGSGERIVFDDVQTVLAEPPLRLMLNKFLSGDWDWRGTVSFALEVTQVLEEIHK